MTVYAVVCDTWEGITFIELYAAKHSAKTRCRELNKSEGGLKKYTIKEMKVN